jgi:hypothetical protein
MEVKIGVQNAVRELVIDSTEAADDIEKVISKALGDEDGVLTLADSKGRRVIVPVAKLAYVEIGTSTSGHVGYRT